MFSIGLIKSNNFNLNVSEINIENFNCDEIFEHIDFINISDNDDMMEQIVTNIGLTKNGMGETILCNEDDKYIYQICCLQNCQKINGVASLLNIEHIKIGGSAVLLKFSINDDLTCSIDNLTKDDIFGLMKNSIVHTSVHIDVDGTLTEEKFIMSPIEDKNIDDFICLEMIFAKFNLMIYAKKNTDESINKAITRLSNKKIKGNCIVVLKIGDHVFNSLTIKTFVKMDSISWGNICDRELTEEEQDKAIEGIQIANNKYVILNKRTEHFRNTCLECDKLILNNDCVCSGCHRCKYCSSECQKNNWISHKKSCLFDEKFIN